MKVTIIGAGAIGGLLGARLAAAGEARVSALARGATLAALREHGWRVKQGETVTIAPVDAALPLEDAGKLGVQDLIVIAVKGPALAQVASAVAPLLGPQTLVLPAMNGVPWWFCKGVAPFGDDPLTSVDPDGAIGAAIPLANVIGCVVHASAATSAPGVVDHRMGRGLIVGEPGGGQSERVQRLAGLLTRAGFEVKASEHVRLDIWYKLWGNLTMNPVSAITGATIDRLLDDPLVRAFCSAAMAEAAAIGAKIGCAIEQSPDDRHAVTAKLGAFKTSMLQDVEAHRPIELDALVSVVREIGQRVSVPAPNIDALLGLTRLFGRIHGLYPQ
ncbi:2-dehydropantoate 2-reductase [Pandoraea sp. 64-18]|uniref:2-dehydropantoate 2-reductase n=1 Tax=Pandoraea sp. 64-18 TaxID=1895806 RepID=UPI00095B92FE|nr:2-dehydropantoate 2-reductase [Pandoraea sp. 64-18]OJY18158.1 MAG: 2-dehydropantoate 2-reductase [Pandoraea sp. 64-18]